MEKCKCEYVADIFSHVNFMSIIHLCYLIITILVTPTHPPTQLCEWTCFAWLFLLIKLNILSTILLINLKLYQSIQIT